MGYGTMVGKPVDALVVVPPPSPSETNPPLGPAILASTAAEHGLVVSVVDLNISYLNCFRGRTRGRSALAVGDHGKDRVLLATAVEQFFEDTGLRSEPALHLPDTADVAAGMHIGFEAFNRALERALDGVLTPWPDWLDEQLFSAVDQPPPILGISIMGPSQVFLAMVILALAKRRWPDTMTVLGGSHITLLAGEIVRDRRYRRCVDKVLPGHSEEEFAELVLSVTRDTVRHGGREIDRARAAGPVPPSGLRFGPASGQGDFSYLPHFDEADLSAFSRTDLTLPLQFTRGCAYGRCTFCTYPVVEPELTGFDAARAHATIEHLVARHGVTRYSIKDSLFTLPMMLALAGLLLEKGPPIRWSATTKAASALVSHLPALAESGLATLEIGVETIHPSGQRLFDKAADRGMLEEVLLACADSGVTAVVNLIFGLPGETIAQADAQLAWFLEVRGKAPPGLIEGSLNMLEIVRGSPLARRPPPGVELLGAAPWAYCYAWNTPQWRREYVRELRAVELLV